MDEFRLAPSLGTGITQAEREQAESRYAASLDVGSGCSSGPQMTAGGGVTYAASCCPPTLKVNTKASFTVNT